MCHLYLYASRICMHYRVKRQDAEDRNIRLEKALAQLTLLKIVFIEGHDLGKVVQHLNQQLPKVRVRHVPIMTRSVPADGIMPPSLDKSLTIQELDAISQFS